MDRRDELPCQLDRRGALEPLGESADEFLAGECTADAEVRADTEREVLRRGSIEFAPADGDVIRFDRVLDDARLTVLVNVGEVAVPWPDEVADGEVVISSDSSRVGAGRSLAPAEAVVVDRQAAPRSG